MASFFIKYGPKLAISCCQCNSGSLGYIITIYLTLFQFFRVAFQNYYLGVSVSSKTELGNITDSHSQLLKNCFNKLQCIVIWDYELEEHRKEGDHVLDTSSLGHFTYVASSAPDDTVVELLLFLFYRKGNYGVRTVA